jgi:hypothetical protein
MRTIKHIILTILILTSICSCRQSTDSVHPKLYGTFNSTDTVSISTSFIDIKTVQISCDTDSVIAAITFRQIPDSIIIMDSIRDFLYQMDLVFDSISDTLGRDKLNRFCEFRYTNNYKYKKGKELKVSFYTFLGLCDIDHGFNAEDETPVIGGKFNFERINNKIIIKFNNRFSNQAKIDTNTTWCLRTYFKKQDKYYDMDYLSPTPEHFKNLQRGNNLKIKY